ncbi:Uncharacterised protein [Chryseobacterium gleum]|uniref:Uncharacterized protein n=2 Tax=Chryseobacterium gleum TaxID=250 RepID=A0A3S4M4T5_CHRGE|nr:hypothetical protein [Chryseobacterium gleum]QQY30138.1 hypothetical protein I6I60_14775 [Chryseobacterium gleum]VEE05551.1 Uncharacterised protein [Chryseobacterium gleum]
MKNRRITSLVTVMLGLCITVSGQTGNVGINTTSPTKTLDINGELRTRTLPIIPSGTPVVADADGNIGIFKPANPNDFIVYNLDSNIRQNDARNVALTSIRNTVQNNGSPQIDANDCWVVPNSSIILRFPQSAIRRGTVSWGLWFEMNYNDLGPFSQRSIEGGTGQIKLPVFFNSRAYARLYKKTGTNPDVWTPQNTVTVVMQTSQISPYFGAAAAYDSSGNPYPDSGATNANFRYFLYANYSVGDGTGITVDPDSEYKVELLYGIENLSSRANITDPMFLQNWGVQSTGYSFYKN